MIELILAVAGGIGIIGGAGAVIFKVIMPVYRIVKRVEVLEEKSENDYRTLQEQSEFDKAICKGVVALINHEIDGNGIENMKQARNELNSFLIRR